MRLCYIANPESIHTQRWIEYFVKSGHEVSLLNIRGNGKVKIPGVRQYSLRPLFEDFTTSLHWCLFQLRRDRRIRSIINRIKPDILHAHFASNNGWWSARLGFHPFVLTVWGSDVYRDALSSALFKERISYALRSADMITVDSEDLRKTVIALGADPLKIQLVLFGVDTNTFYAMPNKEEIKKILGLTGYEVVLSVRSFRPFYNIDIIIKSIPLVIKDVPAVKFVFKKYEGEEDEKLKRMVKELRVEKYVAFYPSVREHQRMVKFYNAADVYVSIPSWDSSSVSLLEAMACGVAPVVSDFPSNLEWITDGVNGCVVPIRDEKKTAEAIIYLLKNPETRKGYAKLNEEIVKERADYYKHMRRMEELYHSLISAYKSS